MGNQDNAGQIEIVICLILVVASLLVYGRTLGNGFVNYDDPIYVTENPHVRGGLTRENIAWAFTSRHEGNWHPLTWMSHMLDREMYGLNPMGHHATNLMIHITNTLLLFFLFRRMTGTMWRSAFVAALFSLHPLHVESVAWVAERKDVLSTFFGILMFLAYCRFVKYGRFVHYLLAFLFLFLGLMAKPMLVSFPFVLLLMDFWPLTRCQPARPGKGAYFNSRALARLVREKIPFFILASVSGAATFIVERSDGGVKSLSYLSLPVRISNMFVSYANYIFKTVWPRHLAVFYPHPRDTLPDWQVAGAVVLIAGITYAAIRGAKQYPYLTVGWFWYLTTLLPVIGLVQVGAQAMADRYTYFPLTGLFIIFAWGAQDLLGRRQHGERILAGFAVLTLLLLSVSTFIQVGYWENSLTLFQHAARVTKRNWLAHNNLGVALFDQGNVDSAIYHYKTALAVSPGYVFAHNNLGVALKRKKRLAEAEIHYKEAIKLDPQYAPAHYNMGILKLKQNKSQEAMAHFARAIKIDPEYAKAYIAIGEILESWDIPDAAGAFFSRAAEINPYLPGIEKNSESHAKEGCKS